MLIVLEGIDGAGKSTLAEELASRFTSTHKQFTAEILHRGPLKPDADPLDEYENSLEYNAGSLTKLVICDRWYLSELIYGPLYRGRSRMDEFRWAHAEKFLEARGAARFIVTAPTAVIAERLAARGEDFLKPKDQVIVHARYLELGNRLGWRQVNTSLSPNPQVLLTLAWQLQSKVRHLAMLRTYVGPPQPSVLLVSDDSAGSPAFQPYDGAPAFHQRAVAAHRHPLIGMIDESELTPAVYKVLGEPRAYHVNEAGKVLQ